MLIFDISLINYHRKLIFVHIKYDEITMNRCCLFRANDEFYFIRQVAFFYDHSLDDYFFDYHLTLTLFRF